MKSAAIALLAVAIFQQNCPKEFADGQFKSTVREYFPRAELYNPRPDVLHIETHVGNVTPKFGTETFQALMAQKGGEIRAGMNFGDYRWLILGFDDFNIVWPLGGRNFDVLTGSRWNRWAQQMQLNYGQPIGP